MTELEYLKAHHAVTEQAIGTAILEIKDANYGSALKYLKDAAERIDNLETLKKSSKKRPIDISTSRAHNTRVGINSS